MKNYQTIKIETDHQTAVLTFNRPEVLNALNSETVTEALDAVRDLEKNPDVRVLVFTGAGRAFISGADIAEMLEKTSAAARTYSELGHTLMATIQDMGKPSIAAIGGYCLGGGMEVALACDIRLASEKAQFGLPETVLGIIPGWGATQRAARLVGTAHAKELIFTGEIIDAYRALEIGLINRIIPQASLIHFTLDMAKKISRQGQIAIAHAKKVIRKGVEMTLAQGCKTETDAFVSCFETEDRREGMQAFIEKRKPKFTGR